MKALVRPRRQIKKVSGGGSIGPDPPECGGATYVFGTGTTEIEGWVGGGDYDQIYEPGSVLEITDGNRARLRFRNIHGTEECPITIRTATGGAVVTTSTTQAGFLMQNCQWIIIDGTGASGVTYGFQMTAANDDKGVLIERRSKHITAFNMEVANQGDLGFAVHTTDNDGSYDYGDDPIGTPSAFSGANKWTDEDYLIYNISSHDGSASCFYLANNHAKRDDVPDCDGFIGHDLIADDSDNTGLNLKTMLNGEFYDVTCTDNGHGGNPSFQNNFRIAVGFSGSVHDCTGVDNDGDIINNVFINPSWRPAEMYNMTLTNGTKRSVNSTSTAAEEEDGGSVDIHDNTMTGSLEDGIRFDMGNSVAAAASRIVDNNIEFTTGNDCIDVRDEALGTESGNTCTPI